jgi:hypothetical protein
MKHPASRLKCRVAFIKINYEAPMLVSAMRHMRRLGAREGLNKRTPSL